MVIRTVMCLKRPVEQFIEIVSCCILLSYIFYFFCADSVIHKLWTMSLKLRYGKNKTITTNQNLPKVLSKGQRNDLHQLRQNVGCCITARFNVWCRCRPPAGNIFGQPSHSMGSKRHARPEEIPFPKLVLVDYMSQVQTSWKTCMVGTPAAQRRLPKKTVAEFVLETLEASSRDNMKFANVVDRLILTLGWTFVRILVHFVCNSHTSRTRARGRVDTNAV